MIFTKVPRNLARIGLTLLLAGLMVGESDANVPQQINVGGKDAGGRYYPSAINNNSVGASSCGRKLYTPSSNGHWQHEVLRLPATELVMGVQWIGPLPRQHRQFIKFDLSDPNDNTFRYPIEEYASSSYFTRAAGGHHYQCFQAFVHLRSEVYGPQYDDSIKFGPSDYNDQWNVALPTDKVGENEGDIDKQPTPVHTIPIDQAWGLVNTRYAANLTTTSLTDPRRTKDLYQLIVEFDLWCNEGDTCEIPTEFTDQ